MTRDKQSGAVDSDFDDAARDGDTILREALAGYPRTIRPGDIVIDLVQGRPLYIRREVAPTAAEYFDVQDFDLTTYKAHPWLPITPDDTVFECVFIPTKPQDIPGSKGDKSYDYPRGRLARVPVEWLYDADTHRHAEHVIDTLTRLFENAADPEYRQAVVDVAVDTFGTEWVDVALEVGGFDPSNYGADATHRGAMNAKAEEDGSDARTDTPAPDHDVDEDGLGDFDDFDGE